MMFERLQKFCEHPTNLRVKAVANLYMCPDCKLFSVVTATEEQHCDQELETHIKLPGTPGKRCECGSIKF